MSAMVAFRRLHEHRASVNRQLLAAAQSLSPEQLRQVCTIGQGSIWKSLLHLYAAEYVWLAALEGEDNPLVPGDLPGKIPGNQQGDRPIASLAELDSLWTALEDRWQAYLKSLAPEALDDVVTKIATSGKQHRTRRSDILLHVCTHAHYTTAQVVNMLRQVQAKQLPDVMLITLARQQMAAQAGG